MANYEVKTLNEALKKLASSRVASHQETQRALNGLLSHFYDRISASDDLVRIRPVQGNLWCFGSSRHISIMNEDGTITEINEERYMPKKPKKKRYTKVEKDLLTENQRLSVELHNARVRIDGLQYDLQASRKESVALAHSFDAMKKDAFTLQSGAEKAFEIINNVSPNCDSVPSLQRNIGRAEEKLKATLCAASANPIVNRFTTIGGGGMMADCAKKQV